MSIQKKYPLFSIDEVYLSKCRLLDSIVLTIVGKDPFPTNASNIPFIKSTWKELDGRSAGRHLFNSLLTEAGITNFITPKDAAFGLLENNVVLLNASYNFLENKELTKCEHLRFVENALEVNFPILEKSNNVIMCGHAKEMLDWVIRYDSNFIYAPHPALQSRNKSKDKTIWDSFWKNGKLFEKYVLTYQ